MFYWKRTTKLPSLTKNQLKNNITSIIHSHRSVTLYNVAMYIALLNEPQRTTTGLGVPCPDDTWSAKHLPNRATHFFPVYGKSAMVEEEANYVNVK